MRSSGINYFWFRIVGICSVILFQPCQCRTQQTKRFARAYSNDSNFVIWSKFSGFNNLPDGDSNMACCLFWRLSMIFSMYFFWTSYGSNGNFTGMLLIWTTGIALNSVFSKFINRIFNRFIFLSLEKLIDGYFWAGYLFRPRKTNEYWIKCQLGRCMFTILCFSIVCVWTVSVRMLSCR